MQQEITVNQWKVYLKKMTVLCRELINLTREQRCAMRERDLAKFEEITGTLSQKSGELSQLQKMIGNPKESLFPQDPKLSALKEQLADLMEELRESNQINIALVHSSFDLVGPILNLLTSHPSTYGEAGSITGEPQRSIVLDRTV